MHSSVAISITLVAKKFGLDWIAAQWLYFLDNMPASLSANQLRELDQAYGLTRSGNAEIEGSWLELVVRNDYRPGYARLEEFLKTVGRRRLIEPLYVEMMKTPAGSESAKRVYAVARPGLHPLTAAAIDAIVTPEAAEGSE
jgi:hypothetical protein